MRAKPIRRLAFGLLALALAGKARAVCRLVSINRVGGDGQSGAPAQMLPQPLSVQVIDTYNTGLPLPGQGVFFSIDSAPDTSIDPYGFALLIDTADGSQFGQGTVFTDANGVASVQFRLGTSTGPYTISARSYCSAAPSFTETAIAGGQTLAAISPLSQNATITKPLATPLKVSVMQSGQPVAGVNVRWDFISLPAGATGQGLLEVPGFPSTVVASRDVPTNANGESDVQVQLGNMTGDYLVTAQLPTASPNQLQFTLNGRVFLHVDLSTPTIAPITSTATIPLISAINRTTMTVTVYGVGGLTDTVADYPLILRSTYVALSGGHDHEDTGRLIGSYSGSGLQISHAKAEGKTGPSGQIFAIYTSSAVGGYEVLTASSSEDGAVVVDIATVTVSVPHLVLLPETTFYANVGGTQFHAGPPSSSTDHNHYGLTPFNDAITGVAAAYRAKFPTEKLRINDMSLPFGGLFDLNANWHAPHQFHRLGTSADINTTTGLNLTLDTDAEVFLNKLIRNQDFLRSNVEGNHWHLFIEGGGPIHPRQAQ